MAKIPPADIVESIGRMTPAERRALRAALDVTDDDEPTEPAPPVVPSPKKQRTAMSGAERDAEDLLNEFGPSHTKIETVDGKSTYRMKIGDVAVTGKSADEATKLLLKALRAVRDGAQ